MIPVSPGAKVIVLDAKDSFTMQRQFQGAWRALYPGVLEYVALSDGGLVTSVDVASRTVVTDFDKYNPAVANIIPQQRAGRIAEIAGVADRKGSLNAGKDADIVLLETAPRLEVRMTLSRGQVVYDSTRS